MNDISGTHVQSAMVVCPSCNTFLPLDRVRFVAYFVGKDLPCSKCKEPVDWWQAVRKSLAPPFRGFLGSLEIAGARSTIFRTKLAAGEVKEIDLRGLMPAEAEILHLNLTPNGSAFPILVHGNQAAPQTVGPAFHVYGHSWEGLGDCTGNLSIFATWFDPSRDPTPVRHLLEAFRQHSIGRDEGMIVPANTAVESRVAAIVARGLRGFTGPDRLTEFMTSAATYSHQLHVLLNVVASLARSPWLPSKVIGQLRRLLKLRNRIAHGGELDEKARESLPKEAPDLLTAAVFALEYLDVVEVSLAKLERAGKIPAKRRGRDD